jgi:hypothetical protein
MQQYQITLKNEKVKSYDWFAVFLFIINGIAICIFLYRSNFQQLSEGYRGFIALSILILSLIFLFNKDFRKKQYIFLFAFLGIIAYWICIHYWWVGLIVLFLLVLFYISKKPLIVAVQEDGIIYPSFPKKKINWSELNNIIIKDGLLTIDFKNNKLIQQYIDESKTSINEKEFNDFCSQQLRTADTI